MQEVGLIRVSTNFQGCFKAFLNEFSQNRINLWLAMRIGQLLEELQEDFPRRTTLGTIDMNLMCRSFPIHPLKILQAIVFI